MYAYTLENGSRKHTCPQCGHKAFKRVVSITGGGYLPPNVGRCDRESKCAYEYTWKQYFANEGRVNNSRSNLGSIRLHIKPSPVHANSSSTFRSHIRNGPDYIDRSLLLRVYEDSSSNGLIDFLVDLFPNNRKMVERVLIRYLVGTKEKFTVFPTINHSGEVCKAKLIKFDSRTGKRIKDGFSISSLEHCLKREGKLLASFSTDKDVFFGEHLVTRYPQLPIAIVESEKTALIASICRHAFPVEFVWLATGSKSWLKPSRLRRIARSRAIILYPDADGFDKWNDVAIAARQLGVNVGTSHLIERFASPDEKASGYDLADYLIREQLAINEYCRELLQERLAIMIYEAGMTETEALEAVAHPFK